MIDYEPPFEVMIGSSNRAYNALLSILVASDALTLLAVNETETPDRSLARHCEYKSRNGFPVIRFTTHEVASAALRGERISFKILVKPDQNPNDEFVLLHEQHPFDFILSVASAEFLTYYESVVGWLDSNVGTDRNRHPEVFKFARRVRNAIAHYGVISWSSDVVPPVRWRGLILSCEDNDRMVIGPMISVADLVILILDCEYTLTKLGCAQSGAGRRAVDRSYELTKRGAASGGL